MAQVRTDSGLTLRGDIKFFFNGKQTSPSIVDLAINSQNGDIESDPGFETAVLIMLLTDKKADIDDLIPGNSSNVKGWWADVLNGFNVGSKLWLLAREKCDDLLGAKIEEYTNDALQPLISMGVAKSVSSKTSRTGTYTFSTLVTIKRSQTQDVEFTYFYNWYAQTVGGSDAI